VQALRAVGLPVWDPLLESKTGSGAFEILKGLEEFREHLGGILTVTLPQGIGNKLEVHTMDGDLVMAAVDYLKAVCSRTPQTVPTDAQGG